MEHNVIPAGERHGPHQWVVANEAARLALTPTSNDLGSYCWQQSDNTEWMLLSLGPTTWQQRGEQGEPGDAGTPGVDGDDGEPGAPGSDGEDGRTILSGTGVPDGGLGSDGDFYIRTSTWEIYGPKTAGEWGSATALIGAPGEDGAPGAPGADGEDGADGTVIPGGTTGQVLAKASDADGDVVWVDLPESVLIEETLTELEGSDTIIVKRGTDYFEVTLAALATFVGVPPDETAPAAFETGDWTATADVEEIDLNITALPDDGGSSITALQYRLDGGTAVDLTGTGTGARTITGLTGGVEYDVQIRAVNAIGAGAWSDTKTRTALAEPTVPEAFEVGDWTATAGDEEVVLNITALPGNGGSAITALEYRIDGGTATALTGTGTGSRTIGSLTNDTEYDIEIRAVNSVGNGAWSDVKSRTPVAAGGTPPEFIGATVVDGAGTDLDIPVGATADSILIQCVQGLGMGFAENAAPTGWTRIGGGVVQTPDNSSYGIFTAPGDVAELQLPGYGNGYRRCIAVNGALRGGTGTDSEGYDYSNSPGANPPAPSVAFTDGDMILSGYFQIEKAGTFTLTIEPGYTVEYGDDELYSQGQVLVREGATSSPSGTIRHGMTGGYDAFYCFSIAIGPSA